MAVIAMSSLSGAVVHVLAGHVPLGLVAPMAAGAIVGAVIVLAVWGMISKNRRA